MLHAAMLDAVAEFLRQATVIIHEDAATPQFRIGRVHALLRSALALIPVGDGSKESIDWRTEINNSLWRMFGYGERSYRNCGKEEVEGLVKKIEALLAYVEQSRQKTAQGFVGYRHDPKSPVPNTLGGFEGGFYGMHNRAPNKQEIFDAGVRSGLQRAYEAQHSPNETAASTAPPIKDMSKAIGGHARADALSPERRQEIAKAAAAARWEKQGSNDAKEA